MEKAHMAKAAIGKSSANDPLILSKQKISLPLPESCATGKVSKDGAGNGEIEGTGTNGDSG
jgi:hypothetical protein